MNEKPKKITLKEWDQRYETLIRAGLREPAYGGPLRRHVDDGDYRLNHLRYDNSPAALRLWNFLLTEEERLHQARKDGKYIVGAIKDLGTIPVLAYSFPNVTVFYPDGAWWIPCVMELSAGLLDIADRMGIDESFCPVRAMLGAFETKAHFPIPDLLVCSVGAVCDDLSTIAQRLENQGYPIHWWEIPHRRRPEPGEEAVTLPGSFMAPISQVQFVQAELDRIRSVLEEHVEESIDESAIAEGIRIANQVRCLLDTLRLEVYTAPICPLPSLEMQIAEMLAIHFCSDREETINVLQELLDEVRRRVQMGTGVLPQDAARVFWINPVADLRMMNLLEECGGRLCGSDFLFCHALDSIPSGLPPMEALARAALADPMIGPASDRASRICMDIKRFGAEAVVISRIPGASHCALEGEIIRDHVQERLKIPVVEIEVPPLSDAMRPALTTRLEALFEIARSKH